MKCCKMITSFVGLVSLLQVFILPRAAAAAVAGAVGVGLGAAGPAGPALVGAKNTNGLFAQDPLLVHQTATRNADTDRHLVWSHSGHTVCDAATLQRLQLINPNLSIVSCLTSEIQWDPDGLLLVSVVTTTGTYRPYWNSGEERFDVQTTRTAFFTPVQGICQGFDFCLLLDSLEVLLGQFTYDCSNVYCGENAIRDCNGDFQSVACPQGTIFPEIPTLAQITCERVLAFMSDTDRAACNPTNCQLDPALGIDGTWSYSCSSSSSANTGDDSRCLEATVSRHFDEWNEHVRTCKTDNNGNVFCITKSFGPVILANNDFFEPVLLHKYFLCMAEYNGQTCESCTPCGEAGSMGTLAAGEGFTVDIDCSNFQTDSRLNGCDQTATGILEFYYEERDDVPCP